METSYLSPVLSDVQNTIPKLIEFIKASGVEFDAILCRGLSQIIPATIIGYLMKKPLVIARKQSDFDTSHAIYRIEGELHNKYLIIDDLICSGDTIRKLKDEMFEWHAKYGQPMPTICAIFVYQTSYGAETFDVDDFDIPVYDFVKWNRRKK